MNIRQIRDKYRQILEDDDSDSSEEELHQSALALKNATMKSHVLTEVSENVANSKVAHTQPHPKVVIALKERLAQGLKNMSVKQQQNAQLKQQIVKLQEKIKLMEEELASAKSHIQRGEHRLIEEKVSAGSLEKEIEKLKHVIEAGRMDRDLILKQVEFYKNEISSLKQDRKAALKLVQSVEKQVKMIEKVKQQNIRLKEDIKRMHVILNEYSQGTLAKKIEDKHFLGKPYKQANCWFSQNLVGEVEMFLKKEQVGQGNKDFLNNLIKFIDSYSKTTSQKENKPKNNQSRCDSKPQKQSKQHSRFASVYEMNESNARSSQMSNSILKKSLIVSKIIKNGSNKCTQSFILPNNEKDRSAAILSEQILEEFSRAMEVALGAKEVKRKKILRLVEEMGASLRQLLDSDKELS